MQKRVYQPGQTISIIGAGPCGLAFTRALIDMGVNPNTIKVFDKASEPGGKVYTKIIDNKAYEMGASFAIPILYKNTLDLAKKYNISTTTNTSSMGTFNLQSGKFEPLTLEPNFFSNLSSEISRYELLINDKYPGLYSNMGYSYIPEEFNKTWTQFIEDNDFKLLDKFLAYYLSGSGFTHPSSPATAGQLMKTFSPSVVKMMTMGAVTLFTGKGWQELWKQEVDNLTQLGIEFHFNTDIQSIVRDQDKVTIKSNSNEWTSDNLVYTSNFKYLPSLLDRPTQIEIDTYSKVEHTDFRTLMLKIKSSTIQDKRGWIGFKPYIYNIVTDRPIILFKPYVDSDIILVYVYGSKGTTSQLILDNVKQDLQVLETEVVEVLEEKQWEYFPHVTSDMKSFFDSVMSLQGLGGVWVAGEAISFSNVEVVYVQGKYFAEQFVKNML